MKQLTLSMLALAFFLVGCGGDSADAGKSDSGKTDSKVEKEEKKEEELKESDVRRYEDDSTGKYGLAAGYGKSEKMILEPKYDWMGYQQDGELIEVGIGEKKEGSKYLKKEGSKYGYINWKGEEVTPVIYDAAERPVRGVGKIGNKNEEGYFKWGAVDRTGKVRVEPQYNQLYTDHDFGMSVIMTADFKYGVMDSNFNVVHEPKWNAMDQYYGDNGLVWYGDGKGNVMGRLRSGKYGYINTKGEIAIKAQYDAPGRFAEGLAAVKKGKKYGFINPENEVKIDFKYDYAYEFRDGRCPVKIGEREFDIDPEGNELPPEEDK
ncbi:MAG: WG repeat-containing protein [Bacteroidota bacterium]